MQWQHGAVLKHKDSEIAYLSRALEVNRDASTLVVAGSESARKAVAKDEARAPPTPGLLPPFSVRKENVSPPSNKSVGVNIEQVKRVYREGDLEGQAKAQRLVGTRIKCFGAIKLAQLSSRNIMVMLEDDNGALMGPHIVLNFGLSDEVALGLRKGMEIEAEGRIASITGSAISLSECIVTSRS